MCNTCCRKSDKTVMQLTPPMIMYLWVGTTFVLDKLSKRGNYYDFFPTIESMTILLYFCECILFLRSITVRAVVTDTDAVFMQPK